MDPVHFLIFCCLVSCLQGQVTLDVDRPWLRVPVGLPAVLECCYLSHKGTVGSTWFRRRQSNGTTGVRAMSSTEFGNVGPSCHRLPLTSVRLDDSGLYQCFLNNSRLHLFTPGTYLQVYEPLQKTINISEAGKDGLLITEGILLLLCVLLPSAALLYKSKRLHDMEKKKVMSRQENVYLGLNLDECSSAYDQIQRPRSQIEYQDVGHVASKEVEFEKP
ncbi:B-cell antigen receptor complex-associated protein alpha chain [Neosynchiropus ocellatus]